MGKWDHLKTFRIIRLNARMLPIHPAEAAMYRRYDFWPTEVEAHTPEEILSHAADCDALFVVSAALPARVIDGLQKCRLISRLGTGTDKIDVAAAKRRGILVSNVPYFCVEEMADHALGMLIALARKFPQMSRDMFAGAYRRARREGILTRRISGRTLGIVGFGASGKALARRSRACGMNVLATRRNMAAPRDEADALGVEMAGLGGLLERSDFVSLHMPLTPETHHMLDEAALSRMKPGACLINTSRGALVDEQALARHLREGHLAGAGLDTFGDIDIFAPEESPPHHPLAGLDNVILTPHVSGLSVESLEDVAREGVGNTVAVLSGYMPPPENIVNRGVVPWCPLKAHEPGLLEG